MTTTMTTTEGAVRLWREIARGLQAAGYSTVVPEYLKLSKSLSQVRMTELLKGVPEAEHWTELRKLALEALQSLDPLVEAATILAQLPCELNETAALAQAITPQPLPSELQPSIQEGEPEPPVLPAAEEPSKPGKAIRRRRSSTARTHAISSPNGLPEGDKTVVTKSRSSAVRGRLKSRD